MQSLSEIFDTVLAAYGAAGLFMLAMLLAAFCVQMQRWCGVYAKVAGFRLAGRVKKRNDVPPVSVVLPLYGENLAYLDDGLPQLLNQRHMERYEVVVVYVGNDDNFFTDLSRLRQIYPHLVTTQINFTPCYPVSSKMALNIGIKAAHYEHVVMTTPDARPASSLWLSTLSKAFMYGDIVIGYCGVERAKGFSDLVFREWQMNEAVGWLHAAIKGRPYGASRHNLGFTKTLYYSVRGFSHLNLNAGEDDLFVQRVATADNTAPVCTAVASCRERRWGDWRWWFSRVHASGVTRRFYPPEARNVADVELLSRTVFFILAVAIMALMPLECKIAALALLLVRYFAVWFVILRTARRLGERNIASRHFIYDIIEPALHAFVRLTLRKSADSAWR